MSTLKKESSEKQNKIKNLVKFSTFKKMMNIIIKTIPDDKKMMINYNIIKII